MHADFLDGWIPSGLQTVLDKCVNTGTAHPHGSTNICGS